MDGVKEKEWGVRYVLGGYDRVMGFVTYIETHKSGLSLSKIYMEPVPCCNSNYMHETDMWKRRISGI